MQIHEVRTHAEGEVLPQEEQLAYKIAVVATADAPVDDEALQMVGNRIIDNAAVALAALNRTPVVNARRLALGYPHPVRGGATLFGLPPDRTFHCAWAALANGVTVSGVKYGPIKAVLDKQKSANAWVTVSLEEGRNREIRKVMENLGLEVNRLIRVAFGPFQLGKLACGKVEEVTGKVLREQLGEATK